MTAITLFCMDSDSPCAKTRKPEQFVWAIVLIDYWSKLLFREGLTPLETTLLSSQYFRNQRLWAFHVLILAGCDTLLQRKLEESANNLGNVILDVLRVEIAPDVCVEQLPLGFDNFYKAAIGLVWV